MRYKEMTAKLMSILQDIETVAITTDLWTSVANMSYITITCHFVDDNYILRCAVLSTMSLKDETNHSANNIGDTLSDVLQKWNILDKVSTIVTDNDRSMIKMCENLKKRHLPCFAHTLNLIVRECLSVDNIQIVIIKCKKIVTYIKQSNIAYAKFKAAQLPNKTYGLKQEVPTRWNSAYAMLERILATREALGQVLLTTPKSPPHLTAEEVNVIMDIVKLLAPFNDATQKISAGATVTISLIIPFVCGLLENMEDIKTTLRTDEGFKMRELLVANIKKRLLEYEKRTPTRIGTLLDPRSKKEAFLSPLNVQEATKLLENEISNINRSLDITQETSEPPTPIESSQPLLKFLKRNIAQMIKNCRTDSIITLRQYYQSANIDENRDPLKYWKRAINDTTLQLYAKRILCVPATSIESERIFSKAGIIISNKRASLKPSNVDKIVFLSKNQWINE
ncbi:E3 SUMO-protein ligase ZBED1-like [Drosophila nasuta]|uniref:E3 SUMO-protein ligase ZBED1-like n=1 Tax=Drosophila nasuta TaxID=42062 RepID=UPI00295F0CF5|nr:E3 SUMO-protein ligase ZBED1-like [Drosophila nasuta]